MMLGSILTWGFLWPYIDGKAGVWYPTGLKEHDFKGLFGYKVVYPPVPPTRSEEPVVMSHHSRWRCLGLCVLG